MPPLAEDSSSPEPASPLPPARHDPYAALRLRDYRRYLLGSVVSMIGGQIRGVAVNWELYERTDSAIALALVGLIQFLPVLLLTLPAGHAADRYRRKYVMVAAQAVSGVAALGLALTSWTTGPIILSYVCLLIAGIGRAFGAPARWSLLPGVVPTSLLSNAVTWNSSGMQVASVAGPALGGVVIALTGGAPLAYLLDAVCSLVVVVSILSLNTSDSPRLNEPVSLESLLAGFRFVRRNDLILATITLDLFAVLLGGATALLPIFARDILHIGPVGLGWLRAAPSIGAVAMALVIAHRPPLRGAGRALLWCVVGFGLATVVFGLSRNVMLSFLMLALTGAFDNISVLVRSTLVQVLTPNSMRGRVSAVNAIFIGTSNELGGFESGITARLFGPVASVVGGGIGTVLVVLAVALIWPQIRHLDSLHDTKPMDEPEPASV